MYAFLLLCQSALKNRATAFPTEYYFKNRTFIEDELYTALQTALTPYHVTVPQLFLVRLMQQTYSLKLHVSLAPCVGSCWVKRM